MKTYKRCIFHIPNKLDENRASASQIRPKKMAKAFENIGYEVDIVWGTAAERKAKIKKIKKNIKNGVKYDFMYSESSTMPTLLTESHHLPTHPFLDFSFFSFVKKNGIKIGLFYRDIYWKFPIYKEKVKGIKYFVAVLMYRYDLLQYNRLLSKFYQPTIYCKKHVEEVKDSLFDCLPPACEARELDIMDKKENEILNLLYVGGLGGLYKIHKLFEVVKEMEHMKLVVCCRKDDWNDIEQEYKKFLCNNIEIVHKSGKELDELYGKADICLIFFEPDIYVEMAMPFKTFEYLSYGIPMIATKGTAVGKFIQENEVGWTIDYSIESLSVLLSDLQKNPDKIEKKRKICINQIEHNTWEKRAEKVVRDLR